MARGALPPLSREHLPAARSHQAGYPSCTFLSFHTTCSRPAGLLNTVLTAAWFLTRGAPRLPKRGRGRSVPAANTPFHPRHKSTSSLSCGKNSEHQVQMGRPEPFPSRREGPEIPSSGDDEKHRWGRSRKGGQTGCIIARAVRGKRLTRRLPR